MTHKAWFITVQYDGEDDDFLFCRTAPEGECMGAQIGEAVGSQHWPVHLHLKSPDKNLRDMWCLDEPDSTFKYTLHEIMLTEEEYQYVLDTHEKAKV